MSAYVEEDRIRAALSHVPADARDTWVQMGMAVKDELGDGGFDLWDDWSKSSGAYNESDARSVWRSFKAGGITIATLFSEAIAHGYAETEPLKPIDPAEHARRRPVREQEAKDAAKRHERTQAEAADKARELWEKAGTVHADHAYIRSKKIKPYGAKQLREQVVIKIQDVDGVHHSAQYIQPDGSKTFQTGGRISGCFAAVTGGAKPNATTPLLICEGFATACSLHEATQYPVAAAMNAGNLLNVAKAWRAKYPRVRIVICADDDTGTAGNPGMTKATEAARAVGALLAVPDFGPDRPDRSSDFNDLHALDGLDALRRNVDAATAPWGVANSGATTTLKTGENAADGNVWGKLESLPDSLQPVMAFDFDMLPESVRPWAQDIAQRVQCPPDFIAATLVGALGIVIGRRVGIRPKLRDDWTEYANQWVCIVGRPGVMKSPAMSAVLAPIKKLDFDSSQLFENELALFESESKIHKMRQDAVEKKAMAVLKKNPDATVDLHESETPDAPKLTRYLVNDATVEKLGEICADNPQGVGVFRDELVSLLKGLDRDGQESARGFYLTGWNGNDGYVVDRIMRGHQRIEAVCLSVIGSTQPGRLSEYLRGAIGGGAADDGLVQRFGLMVWPDVPRQSWENIDCWPDAEAKHTAHRVFERLMNADPVADWKAEEPTGPDGAPDGNPPFLRFEEAAAEMFIEWRTDLENELRSGDLHPAMESHLAKYRKLVPSLALVFHLAEGGSGAVSAAATARALAWAVYLRSHAERAYGSVMLAEAEGAKALLKRIKAGDVQDGFASRDVYHGKH